MVKKLSTRQWCKICGLYKGEMPAYEIAGIYDGSTACIYCVLEKCNIEWRQSTREQLYWSLNVAAFDFVPPESTCWVGFLVANRNLCYRYSNKRLGSITINLNDRYNWVTG